MVAVIIIITINAKKHLKIITTHFRYNKFNDGI